jgi:branched-chain amino acid transport system ATP-binding protein
VPTRGDVFLTGRRVNGAAPDALARIGICTIPEGRGIFPNLTVTENLRMVTYAGSSMADVLEHSFEQFPRLKERRSQLAGTMSGGEQQMLAMARGLASNPAVLLLDELSMGLAPIIVKRLLEAVARVARQQNTAVLLVEQHVRKALEYCDRAYVMHRGRIELSGSAAELLGRIGEIEDRYLTAATGPAHT